MAGESGEGRGFGGWLVRLTEARHGRAPELGVLPLDTGPPAQVANVQGSRCVFDGTLHNRAELARIGGLDLRTDANDAEAVLRLYLRLGEPILGRLRGVFAVAI